MRRRKCTKCSRKPKGKIKLLLQFVAKYSWNIHHRSQDANSNFRQFEKLDSNGKLGIKIPVFPVVSYTTKAKNKLFTAIVNTRKGGGGLIKKLLI